MRRGGGGRRRGRRETAVDKSEKEMADRVARHQADQEVEHAYTANATNWYSWFERGFLFSLSYLLIFSFWVLIVCELEYTKYLFLLFSSIDEEMPY